MMNSIAHKTLMLTAGIMQIACSPIAIREKDTSQPAAAKCRTNGIVISSRVCEKSAACKATKKQIPRESGSE
jgi:hypothetical protein